VATTEGAFDNQKLVDALKDAGFGGMVAGVRSASTPSEQGDGSDDAPPAPDSSLDKRGASAAGTTYSSKSFARHVQINAYPDHDVVCPGNVLRIAVVFDIDDGWHIYGNPLGPGIGQETVVSARGSDTFEFGPARYAPAHRKTQDFGEAGKTWVWEHTGKTVHFLAGKVSEATAPGTYQLTIETTAQVCTEGGCLPGKATIVLPVTVVPSGSPSKAINAELFVDFEKAKTPRLDS